MKHIKNGDYVVTRNGTYQVVEINRNLINARTMQQETVLLVNVNGRQRGVRECEVLSVLPSLS